LQDERPDLTVISIYLEVRRSMHQPGALQSRHTSSFAMNLSSRLSQLCPDLPAPIHPLGSYRTLSISGNQLYVSGLGPFENGKPIVGVVGVELPLEAAQRAARLTMLMILSCIKAKYGLDKIDRCSRLTVYVRADASFTQHPQVADGASDLLRELFGVDKLPARSAIGVHTLPMGIPVEIDSIFELKT
jgi:enamine deaminase RidA (YjgF/YER057c/UK114 family)